MQSVRRFKVGFQEVRLNLSLRGRSLLSGGPPQGRLPIRRRWQLNVRLFMYSEYKRQSIGIARHRIHLHTHGNAGVGFLSADVNNALGLRLSRFA